MDLETDTEEKGDDFFTIDPDVENRIDPTDEDFIRLISKGYRGDGRNNLGAEVKEDRVPYSPAGINREPVPHSPVLPYTPGGVSSEEKNPVSNYGRNKKDTTPGATQQIVCIRRQRPPVEVERFKDMAIVPGNGTDAYQLSIEGKFGRDTEFSFMEIGKALEDFTFGVANASCGKEIRWRTLIVDVQGSLFITVNVRNNSVTKSTVDYVPGCFRAKVKRNEDGFTAEAIQIIDRVMETVVHQEDVTGVRRWHNAQTTYRIRHPICYIQRVILDDMHICGSDSGGNGLDVKRIVAVENVPGSAYYQMKKETKLGFVRSMSTEFTNTFKILVAETDYCTWCVWKHVTSEVQLYH